MALKGWFEWATTGRAVIRRRDHLIRMGLASRRELRKLRDLPAAGPDSLPAA